MSSRCTMLAVVLCACATSFGTISFSSNTLTYSSPSDLGTTIDPSGQKDVTNSYGITKASFQALNPQVVAFNGAPAPTQTLRTLVANYTTTGTVTFTFPAAMYNYGSYTDVGHGAFSGSAAQDAISTVPSTPDSLTDWFDATITSTGGQGVQSLGFCAAFRNDQAVPAGQVLFTLSDSTTGSVTLPALGGSGNPEYVFIGYTAPSGKTITRVQASRTSAVGGAWVSVDDLAFVMSADTTAPAAVSNLATSSPTSSSITLTWIAPGDDGSTGTATTYDIRYSTSTINAGNWASATQVSGEPAPLVAGSNQSMTVGGLSPNTTYYFAMKTADEVPNWSALSNVASGTTSAQASGLIAQWMLDENAGTTASDATGNGSTGTLTNGPAWTTGKYGSALSFDNVDDYVAGTFNPSLTVNGAMTMAAWIYASATPTNSDVVLSLRDTSALAMITLKANASVYKYGDSLLLAGSQTPASGQWVHLCFTCDGTTNRIYVNAVDTGSNTAARDTGTVRQFRIGIDCYGNFPMNGKIDDVRVYNRALSPSEVTTLYQGGTGDTTPPAAVSNLATSSPTNNSITLSWTAPGDDGSTGTATSYDIRYRTGGAVNDSNWASATQVSGEPTPLAAGTNQNMVVSGLTAGTTYYFAIKTSDEVPNISAISNSPSGTTTTSDTTAPAAVSNLSSSGATASSVTLTWTAPGDDGSTGTATTYDIRYSTSTITAGNWGSATQVSGEPAPQVAGTNQSMTVSGLAADTTYYFAMETADEVPNWSALSNVYSRKTSDTVAPAAVSNLATGSPTSSSITLTWTAPGDNGSTGTATTYDIRYSTSTITSGNWASATQVTGEPAPLAAGNNQSMVISGLNPSTTYYFAIETADEVPNWSALSNVPSGTTTAASDTTPPAAVSNLATSSPTNNSITLSWTAPGDDGSTGTATTYDIRYSTSTITAGNFSSATQVSGEPAPLVAGTNQNMTVSGLSANTTYYFAMKTADEVPNWSTISNVPSATTTSNSGNNKPILGQSDFVYQGYYIVQSDGNYNNMAELVYGQGFTHRYVSGQLRFLTFSFFGNVSGGGNHVIEFAPPAGGLGGTITTRTNHWPDIMGSTGLDVGSMRWMGLWFEQAQNRLWTTWAVDYPSDQQATFTKSIVVRTLNADGTVSNIQGPWGLQGIQQRRIYGGVQAVPSWFQSTYGVGPYSAGWGGYSSIMSVGPVSLGPTCYTFPEPTGYPVGDIPSSAFKTLMDHSAASLVVDWYPNGSPTSYDRGVRNTDVQNDYDNPKWQSPAPDGLGRWVWGDSNWNTGCWIETSDKQGFITVPKFQNGRGWYQNSNLHCERQSAEIQVFDPNMLGQVAQGTRASWNTYPTNRWEITSTLTPLGFNGARDGFGPGNGPCGASYDSTTQTLYIYCVNGTGGNSYILVYHVN